MTGLLTDLTVLLCRRDSSAEGGDAERPGGHDRQGLCREDVTGLLTCCGWLADEMTGLLTDCLVRADEIAARKVEMRNDLEAMIIKASTEKKTKDMAETVPPPPHLCTDACCVCMCVCVCVCAYVYIYKHIHI